ncbi:META domain-containing protein [Streptomyces antimicrobicus]|uniref:META domain-containing protein n=1 Tax=Streptomyces antimicrobicus TaxID=2883108 RepID=A0ABS8BDT9_9ACTN|nr:META domain-containing protein [Streptomyces antimicrobicus]MCB5182788.1 META domain-containing protein [Streptomyces antimicrobicus]
MRKRIPLVLAAAVLALGCGPAASRPAPAGPAAALGTPPSGTADPAPAPSGPAPDPTGPAPDPSGPAAGVPLTGTRWTVDRLIADGRSVPVPAAARGAAWFTLSAEGRASGNLGCNRFSAPVAYAADGSVAFGPVLATRMACTGPPGEVERALTALLAAGPLTVRITDRSLLLTAADGASGLTATTTPDGATTDAATATAATATGATATGATTGGAQPG